MSSKNGQWRRYVGRHALRGLVASIAFPLLLTTSLSCTHLVPTTPPNLPPGVTAQFYATYVIKDLDVIRDFASDAAQTNPPIISAQVLLKVVDWHERTVTLIHAAPQGWKVTVTAALNQLEGLLSAADYAKVKAFADAVRLYLQEAP